MATGYDNRGAGRQSFAFQPVAPVQGRGTLSAQTGRSGIQGGATAGEVVHATPQTDIAPGNGSGIPDFLAELAKPMIEERQKAAFFEGVAAAQNGEAVADIEARRPAWARMFGPSHVEQGAAMYTATARVLEYEQGLLGRMDELKRMTPQELGAELARGSGELANTGSQATDNLINAQLVERSGPILNLVAQERVKHQQEVVTRAQTTAVLSGAANYQTLASNFARLTEPTEVETEAFTGATQSFLNLLVPPAGQTEESYKGMMGNLGLSLLQDRNFYAFEAIRRTGVFDQLDEGTARRIEERYDRMAPRALTEALATIGPDMWEFEAKRVNGEVSPIEVAAQYAAWNEQLMRATGITGVDKFDIDFITGEVVETARDVKRQSERAEDIERTERHRQEDREYEEQKAEREAAQAMTFVQSGTVGTAVITGAATRQNVETAMLATYRSGDVAAIVRNAISNPDQGISQAVKGEIEGQVRAGSAAGINSEAMQNVYGVWQAMSQVDGGPAARAAYFGDSDAKFLQMHNLVAGGTEAGVAFQVAFGTERVAPANLTREERSRVTAAARTFSPNLMERTFGGGIPINESGQRVLVDIIGRDFTNRMAASPGMSEEDAMRQSIAAKRASGELEIVGGFVWVNPRNDRRTLQALTGLNERELNHEFREVVGERFEAIGFSPGSYSVHRMAGSDANNPTIVIMGYKDGKSEAITVTPRELTTRTRGDAASRTDLLRRQREWDRDNSPSAPGIGFQESFRRTQETDFSTRPR